MVAEMCFISLARMHHISNPAKFRKLKQFATHANVSGLVKTGKPGVLVLNGYKPAIKEFLQSVRALRYLDFHHVDTKPFEGSRIADSKTGLHIVEDMNEVIQLLDIIGEKAWFRRQMGMSKDSD